MSGLCAPLRYTAGRAYRHLPGSPLCRFHRRRVVGRFSYTLRILTSFRRSPDGQALLLSSADGYCSIIVFDMAELGTVHPTQQHHRQLAAIAQSHSHSLSHAPPSVSHSPALSTMRHSPAPGVARSEREGSASSSIAPPPLFVHSHHPPSSTASSTDPNIPTPGEESDAFGFPKTVSYESNSSTGLGISAGVKEAVSKRTIPEGGDGPKKKRRVALTHLGSEEGT